MTGDKHDPYKYRFILPSEIDKYGSQHGAAAAAWHLPRKLEEQAELTCKHNFIPFSTFSRHFRTVQPRVILCLIALPHLFVYVFLTVGFPPFQCVFSTLSNENENVTRETQNFPNVHFPTLNLYLAGRQPPTDNHTHPLTNKYMQIPA